MTRGLIVLVAILGWCSAALGHEFYDPWCCNETDCAPYTKEVIVTPDGFYIPEFKVTIAYKDAKYDMPGDDPAQYHLCEYPKGTVRCLYVRPGGV